MKTYLLAAVALSLTTPALASNLVTNGSFETVGAGFTGKTGFFGNVTGWSGGGALTFIDYAGTADDGSYLSVYRGFPATSPDGGKFVEADGDGPYRSALTQTIGGLTVGKSYTLKFYQAAGQQVGSSGPTTEQWTGSFGERVQTSTLYSLPQGATGAWQAQTMTFTADFASQVINFLATGTPGGGPSTSFIDGISLTESVPEPASWALMLGGFGFVGAATRRRATATVAASSGPAGCITPSGHFARRTGTRTLQTSTRPAGRRKNGSRRLARASISVAKVGVSLRITSNFGRVAAGMSDASRAAVIGNFSPSSL
jgi:hypothetical protein